MNLSFNALGNENNFFAFYKGLCYTNKNTNVHIRINNKMQIENVLKVKFNKK